MAFEIRESLPLARFIDERSWTPLKGTYLNPLRSFGHRSNDPNAFLEVVTVIKVKGTDMAITRGSGLFVRDRGQYSTPESRDALAALFNLVLCELAFHNVASQPVTDVDIQDGRLIGRYASIIGGFDWFTERTYGPHTLLLSRPGGDHWAPNFYWHEYYWAQNDGSVRTVLDAFGSPENGLALESLSPTLPTLLVAAVYHAFRHHLGEAIVTAWIVCEQILSHLWDRHVTNIEDPARRKRLEDSRTYSASVQAEVLLTKGELDNETYRLVQSARKLRNDLAHRSLMGHDAVDQCTVAMGAMLRKIGLRTDTLPCYMRRNGGGRQPERPLEPDFPFE
jgi:hypothetical protein